MKYIVKGEEPEEVTQFRRDNVDTPQIVTYDNLPKAALRAALLREQGNLCAYTMLRLETTLDGHIEHVVAQAAAEDLRTDYDNMVFCFPGKNVSSCKYGAGRKTDREIGVSPLNPDCETRLLFSGNGSVSCADPTDVAAKTTIEVILALNHSVLIEARKAAIAKLPIARTKHPLTAREAESWAVALSRRDTEGKFQEFAAALVQIMMRYALQKSARTQDQHPN